MKNALYPKVSNRHMLQHMAQNAKIVVFTGFPCAGRGQYLQQCLLLARGMGKEVSLIQWKTTKDFFDKTTTQTNDQLQQCMGNWLLDTIEAWVRSHPDDKSIVMIEAPFVEGGFIELAQKQQKMGMESLLSNEIVQFVAPVPTEKAWKELLHQHKKQTTDSSRKHLDLWKQMCVAANAFGQKIELEEEKVPNYTELIYVYVFTKVLKHRHLTTFPTDKLYWEKETNQNIPMESLPMDLEVVKEYVEQAQKSIPTKTAWYLT
ncbi:MAG: hypothetical protein ACPGXL_03415 [Chitinophagales bacterium]